MVQPGSADLVVRSRRVVFPDGVRAAAVVVRAGRIEAIAPHDEPPPARETEDCGDACLMPGLVDTHVHVNEPGRTAWEGFDHATRAAAAGGITTVVDMPLNSVPATTMLAALGMKRGAAGHACHVDVGFWGGVVPGNAGDLEGLAAAGVMGFKCFMVPSGVDEFAPVEEQDLREAMPILARLARPLLVHAELPGALRAVDGQDPRKYATWLASRPPAAETQAIRLLLRLAAETGCAVHIVHLATTEALHEVHAARTRRVPVTVETCPHYLTFAAEEIEDGATAFKCAPPIRERAQRQALWQALRDGAIHMIASDHSPCPPELKRQASGDFMAAWGGIASLEAALAAVWSGARVRGISPADLARWMAEQPARLAGLAGIKGAIAPGADADFVMWNPDEEWTVDAARLHQRHPLTPYHGRKRATWLRGLRVFERTAGNDAGRFAGRPTGRLLARADAAAERAEPVDRGGASR
jgi:allantoinase